MPPALVVSVQATTAGSCFGFGILPPLPVKPLPGFGMSQLGHFRKHESVWVNALDRMRLVALVKVGLAPFRY